MGRTTGLEKYRTLTIGLHWLEELTKLGMWVVGMSAGLEA